MTVIRQVENGQTEAAMADFLALTLAKFFKIIVFKILRHKKISLP
jgi:hypothetical protein